MDVSAALETEINDSGIDESSATEDVAEALSSLPRANGTSGTSSDDNKFQSAIAAWRSISGEPFSRIQLTVLRHRSHKARARARQYSF